MLRRPHAVVYFVHDIGAARDWYRALLQTAPTQDDPAFVRFALDGVDLAFHPADAKSGAAHGSQVAYWTVENLDEALHRFLSAGAQPFRSPIPIPQGGRVCQVADPFGNIVGLREITAATSSPPAHQSNRPTVIVRPAILDDQGAIDAVNASAVKILRQTYRPTPAAVQRRAQRSAPRRRIVAVAEGKVVGTTEFEFESERLHLSALGVSEAWRKRGIGRQMVDYLARLAAMAGATTLSLYTVRQTGNVAVFEKMGFRSIREEPAVDLIGEQASDLTDVYMERASV